MPPDPNRLSQFWQELQRRKVLPFLIAYVAACFAIIEFFDIASNRFTIPDRTFDLLYSIAAIGLPVVIILPWFINRKQQTVTNKVLALDLKTSNKEGEKVLHNLPLQLTTFIGRVKWPQP